MAIPFGIWAFVVILALLGTAVSWFTRDSSNYTNAISGIVATLMWMIAGISCLLGIQTEYSTFTAGWLMWIFVAIGVIEAVISIVTILDIVTARNNENHTTLDPIGLGRFG